MNNYTNAQGYLSFGIAQKYCYPAVYNLPFWKTWFYEMVKKVYLTPKKKKKIYLFPKFCWVLLSNKSFLI